MAAKALKPVWINLEYLSAEDWTRERHRQPSPHPRYAADQAFLLPRLRGRHRRPDLQQGLLDTRRQWQDDALARRAYWQLLELPEPAADEWRVSLFAYENPAVTSLLATWALGERPVTCLVPEGKALPTSRACSATRCAPACWRARVR